MAFETHRRPRSIIILELAIFLILFLIRECNSEKFSVTFITKPKRKEIFVGDSVQFDWDYKDEDDQVGKIVFGISIDAEGSKLMNFLEKQPGQDFVTYINGPARERGIVAVQGKRASFSIKNVRLNDTGYYFCFLYPKAITMLGAKDIVFMEVVDLQIDEKQSDTEVESWQNQQVSLACSVRVTDNTPVQFTWQRTPSNKTISRGKHVDANKESILKLITSNDEHFSTYTCIAKTKKTTKKHNIRIKRLYGPGAPEKLQSQLTFKKGDSSYKLTWNKPETNGGADITGYIIEYKPEGITWDKATRKRHVYNKLEYTLVNLKEGKTYDVRVRARNKVTEGEPSNEIQVKINIDPSKRQASSNTSSKASNLPNICLITVSLVIFLLNR